MPFQQVFFGWLIKLVKEAEAEEVCFFKSKPKKSKKS
jgi:hypothetical protein